MYAHITFNKMGIFYQGENYKHNWVFYYFFLMTWDVHKNSSVLLYLCGERDVLCVEATGVLGITAWKRFHIEGERAEVTPKCGEIKVKTKFDNSGKSMFTFVYRYCELAEHVAKENSAFILCVYMYYSHSFGG